MKHLRGYYGRLMTRVSCFALSAAAWPLPIELAAQGPATPAASDSAEIRSDPCSACQINLEPVSRVESSNYITLGTSAALAVTSTERVLVASFPSGGTVVQLTMQGAFERRVSGNGVGPGELTAVTDIVVGPGDTIYIFDGIRRWMHRVSPDGRFIDRTLQPGGIHRALPLGGQRLLVSAAVPSRGAAGYPLHILDATGIVQSLGEEIDMSRAGDGAMIRYLARGTGDTVWVGDRLSYRIEAWSVDGRRKSILTRIVDWFPPSRTPPPTSPQLAPQQTTIRGLFYRDKYLWVVMSVADSAWKPTPLKPSPVPDMYAPDRVLDPYLDTVIEVIDLQRRVVVASLRDDRALFPISGGFLASYEEDHAGRSVYNIIRPRLSGSTSQTMR